jgi:uncharacterized protein (UPF0332 family)
VAEQHELLAKARQSLQGAESEYANQRYDNAANRAYYACFQAAVAALIDAGGQPITEKGTRSHAVIQALFAQQLIHRRKRYPMELASVLPDTLGLREHADYTLKWTSEVRAKRALEKAQGFVAAVRQPVKEGQ